MDKKLTFFDCYQIESLYGDIFREITIQITSASSAANNIFLATQNGSLWRFLLQKKQTGTNTNYVSTNPIMHQCFKQSICLMKSISIPAFPYIIILLIGKDSNSCMEVKLYHLNPTSGSFVDSDGKVTDKPVNQLRVDKVINAVAVNQTSDRVALSYTTGAIVCYQWVLKDPANIPQQLCILELESIAQDIYLMKSKNANTDNLIIVCEDQMSEWVVSNSSPPISFQYQDNFEKSETKVFSSLLSNNLLCIHRNETLNVYEAESGCLYSTPVPQCSLMSSFNYSVILYTPENYGGTISIYLVNKISILRVGLIEKSNIKVIFPVNNETIFLIKENLEIEEILERNLQYRIDALIKEINYYWTLYVVSKEDCHPDLVAKIDLLYSNWLINQKQYEKAAIKLSESNQDVSIVAAKFLKHHQIGSLLIYLKNRLYKHGINDLELKLLFRCFCLLNDKNKFYEFLNLFPNLAHSQARVALEVCREAQHFDFAKRVAITYNLVPELLLIMVENLKCYKEALNLLMTLPDETICSLLLQRSFGKPLLIEEPEETKKLLKSLIKRKRLSLLPFLGLFVDIPPENSPPPKQLPAFDDDNDDETNDDAEDYRLRSLEEYPPIPKNEKLENILIDLMSELFEEEDPINTNMELILHWFDLMFAKARRMKNEIEKATRINNAIISMVNKYVKTEKEVFDLYVKCNVWGNVTVLMCIMSILLDMYDADSLGKDSWIPNAMTLPLFLEEVEGPQLVDYSLKLCSKDSNYWVPVITAFIERQYIPYLKDLLKDQVIKPDMFIALNVIIQSHNSNKSNKVTLGDVKDFFVNESKNLEVKIETFNEEMMETLKNICSEHRNRSILQHKIQEVDLKSLKCFCCNYKVSIPFLYFHCKHAFHQSCFIRNCKNTHICSNYSNPTNSYMVSLHETYEKAQKLLEAKSNFDKKSFNNIFTVYDFFGEFFGSGVLSLSEYLNSYS